MHSVAGLGLVHVFPSFTPSKFHDGEEGNIRLREPRGRPVPELTNEKREFCRRRSLKTPGRNMHVRVGLNERVCHTRAAMCSH